MKNTASLIKNFDDELVYIIDYTNHTALKGIQSISIAVVNN